MAVFGKVELFLNVSYGSKKFAIKLKLPDDDTGDVLTVKHLMEAVAEVAEIKPENQKLIYKGRSLTDPSQTLVGLGVKDGAKIMLLGKKSVAHDTEDVKKLFTIEIAVEKHDGKMIELREEIDGIRKGFLNKDLVDSALSQLKKKVGLTNEQLMKQFEVLDALRLDEDNKEARIKRKNVADRLNKSLDVCETLSEEVKELQSKTS
ncbi:hypothetical protein SNE40_016670 [Patella caerulea]|uniref:Ubiquitin-like domain-containing protein n=1 Tax=Patella caerulea TaxID=87958 RepID=A0AAN8J8Z7_PATCE